MPEQWHLLHHFTVQEEAAWREWGNKVQGGIVRVSRYTMSLLVAGEGMGHEGGTRLLSRER